MTNTLRTAREAAGLSRERVAAALVPPVSSKTLERWERDDAIKPKRADGYSRNRYRQLAKLYGVKVDELKDGNR